MRVSSVKNTRVATGARTRLLIQMKKTKARELARLNLLIQQRRQIGIETWVTRRRQGVARGVVATGAD
jgi:hypothetical protein